MALQRSREQFGDNATLLFDDYFLPSSVREICASHGKEKGGPWECYHAVNFFGWEAERVVVVTTGLNILEIATRAKRELILIIAEPEKEVDKEWYQEIQMVIKAAEDESLVDLQVLENVNEKKIENTSNTATEDIEVENENNCFFCCSVM